MIVNKILKMKNRLIKVVIWFFILNCNITPVVAKDFCFAKTVQSNLAEQIYNKLVVSTRIVRFTNQYIDSKKTENPNIPDNVWIKVKDGIDYSFFKNGAIQILNNNLTSSQMQEILNDFANESSIPIPGTKIKKELYDLSKVFEPKIEQKIHDILSSNGF